MTVRTNMPLTGNIIRTSIDKRNIYDGHHEIHFHYRKDDKLMAITCASGYPTKNEFFIISTIRPPHTGRFSNGDIVKYFSTLDEMDDFIVCEIQKGTICPYNEEKVG